MWGMKATDNSGSNRNPGTDKSMIKKVLEKYIQQMPSNIKIHEPQKITPLGTSHILPV